MLLSQFLTTLFQTLKGMPPLQCTVFLFLCWLGWSSWYSERFSIVGYISSRSFNCCLLFLWMGYGWDWCMYPHRKYQVKPHWCPWFSATCAIVIVHINYFFPFSKKDKIFCLRQSSDRRIIVRKEFLKLSDLLMLIKQESITCKKTGSCTFLTIANSVL